MPRIPVILQKQPIGSTNPNVSTGRSLPAPSRQMRGPALSREQFVQRAMNRTQANTRAATQQATASDDADCTVIRGVSFTANQAQALSHALGKSWTSYRIENVTVAFARFMATRNATTDVASITVTADATCLADVRVW